MNTPATNSNNSPSAADITDISSMLLPLDAGYLLLPGVTVAEIVTFMSPETDTDEEVPNWLLGDIYWRNQKLPLVSYEALMGGQVPPMGSGCRIAVLNNAGSSHQLEFFAILLQGTPRLLRLTPEDLTHKEDSEAVEGEKLHVKVADQEAVVPDILFIEKAITDYQELS